MRAHHALGVLLALVAAGCAAPEAVDAAGGEVRGALRPGSSIDGRFVRLAVTDEGVALAVEAVAGARLEADDVLRIDDLGPGRAWRLTVLDPDAGGLTELSLHAGCPGVPEAATVDLRAGPVTHVLPEGACRLGLTAVAREGAQGEGGRVTLRFEA